MKRVISVILCLVILASIFAVCASAFSSGGFTYTTSGTTATITAWSSSTGALTIPATVTYSSTTYRVTAIGDYAFAEKPNITSVTFNGTNLTTIGEGAFSTNRKCSYLSIPANVTTIGARAFHSWVALDTLLFDENSNLRTIGNWAFRNAQSLASITFPTKQLTTIGDRAFSYCTSLSMIEIPQCVTSIGEEAFLGCINLSYVAILNKTAAIGSNAFDLTYGSSTKRMLKLAGYGTSTTAKAYANAESLTYVSMDEPVEGSNETITTPTAGSYNIRVTYSLSYGGAGLGKPSIKNTFGSRTSIITDSDTAEDECNTAAGIAVQYKNNNGQGSTTSTKCWGPTSFATGATETATISGFPTLLYSYSNYSGSTRHIVMNVTKLEIKGTSQENYTTLWEGSLNCNSTNKPYAATVNSAGTTNATVINSDSATTATNGSGYSAGWASKFPTESSITDMTGGVTSMVVNPDGSKTTAPTGFKPGTVKDQYEVVMSKIPEVFITNNTGSTTGISINSYRRIELESTANRASNYTITVKQKSGSFTASKTKSVSVTTFKYNVTFTYYLGVNSYSTSQTVNYNSRATAPSETPCKYNADNHQYFSSWSRDLSTPFTSGRQNVVISANYTDAEEHNYIESSESAPTCTSPGCNNETCACGYVKTVYGDPPINHDNWDVSSDNVEEITVPPVDGKCGAHVYHCLLCNSYCTEKIDNLGNHVPDEDFGVFETLDEAREEIAASDDKPSVPAPSFNNFSYDFSGQSTYNYQMRGGSLKMDVNKPYVDQNTTQALRFCAAIAIPNGIDYRVGTKNDNVITDFGFLYTQDRYLNSGNDILLDSTTPIGNKPIVKMSVKDNNVGNGNFNGSNWAGVSVRNNGTVLTFNLLIDVKAKNWNYDYAARPYIKYLYNGTEYTLYDIGTTPAESGATYFSRSVAYVATQVVESPTESQDLKNYFQQKVINHLSELPH